MEVSIALTLAACLVLLGNHLSGIAAERHRKRLSATDVQALQHSLEVLHGSASCGPFQRTVHIDQTPDRPFPQGRNSIFRNQVLKLQ